MTPFHLILHIFLVRTHCRPSSCQMWSF